MLVQQSHTRAHHLSDMLSSTLHQNDSKYSIQQDLLPIPVITKIRDSLMVVEIGIGTFNNGAYKSYLLMMDTGGTNIWIQCEDCLKPKGNCYPQKEDYFPNSKSISYLPYKPRLTYAKIYMGGTTSSGVFGTNIKPPQSSITINFLKLYEPRYMVNVVDLGVNKEHLHINKIKLYSGKIKGFLVDPGSPISHLSKGAYDVVVSKLDKHFSQHKGEFRKENQEGWLCYSRINGAQGYSNVPGITYYFEGGAQLDVNPEDTFFRQRGQGREEILCLAILQSKFEQNILGAYQQVNYKFIYNIKDKTLQFGREDCAKNG
ncbi:unnamed protein product [Lupinus luteus]|uniref:Xylanase inhibitor C-terminal domain-containing protein n=1 Tax=Lupinus luteus TaxID=3873 RepID=A0AAV1X5T8_LUPLU